MFLLKVSIPSLSHMGSDCPCDTTEGVMITIREVKTVRNEQLEVRMVWEKGGRISQSGSLTNQTPSHIAALSPVPTAIAVPWSHRLSSPSGAEGHGTCYALTGVQEW